MRHKKALGNPLAAKPHLPDELVGVLDGQQRLNSMFVALQGNGFGFDTDFIMRACLVLAECPIRLRVTSFKAENVTLIVNDWKKITAAIERAVGLLDEWGFQGQTLPSANAVIPITG